MSKLMAFAAFVATLALCLGLAAWRSSPAQARDLAPAIFLTGGLFTVAIAVLIRD